jgi:toluene monooxygenase system ferredoxin subunit
MTGRWRETMNIDDLWEGDMTAVTVNGETVLLVNLDGTVLAYSNRCPHQASALDEGDLDGDTLTCAKHLWEFNAATGCGINPSPLISKGNVRFAAESSAWSALYLGLI